MRCQLGVILRAPPGEQPRCDHPFLIVDDQLKVRALSHRAELALRINEPRAYGALLWDFLIPDDGDATAITLARQIARALGSAAPAGIGSRYPVELRTADDRGARFLVRVTSCRSPTGAVLVLAPLPVGGRDQRNGHKPIETVTTERLTHERA